MPGDEINEPIQPGPLPELQRQKLSDLETFAVSIDGERWEHWTECEVKQSIDTFSTVSIKAPFEATRPLFRALFKPFSYKRIEVWTGPEKAFTGQLVGIEPSVTADRKECTITAYALPAVLHDVALPANEFPADFKGLTLESIANKICEPFGFSASLDFGLTDAAVKKDVRAGVGGRKRFGTAVERVKLEHGDRLFDFLAGIAQERGLVFSDDVNGDVLFFRSARPGRPVAKLQEGESPVVSIKPSFSAQQYFSEITGWAPARQGRQGAKFTVVNPFLQNALRPHSFNADHCRPAELETAVKHKLSCMLAEMVSYDVELATMVDPAGTLYEPNTTVMLRAFDAMIYTMYEFLIRSVTRRQVAESTSCTLELVLPGAFSSEMPESLPWDEPDEAGHTIGVRRRAAQTSAIGPR